MVNYNNPIYQVDIKNAINVPGIEQLCGKTFLITGATGLIGLHLIDALLKLDDVRIIAVGRSKEKASGRLGHHFSNPNFKFISHDITKPLDESVSPDYIIPLASSSHPLAFSKYPVETMLVNFHGAVNALELATKCKSMIIYPSTGEIYGNAHNAEDIFNEDYTGNLSLSTPRSCYNESKRSAEALCQSFASEFGTDVRIVRISRAFGPTKLEDDSKASAQFINNALAKQDIVLKSQGLQEFSYTYVTDVVNAILYVMLYGEKAEAYNIAGFDVLLRDFAKVTAEKVGTKVDYQIPDEIEQRGYSLSSRAILDTTKLRSLGWTPQYNLDKALTRTIAILSQK